MDISAPPQVTTKEILGPPYTWKKIRGVLDLDDDALNRIINSQSFLDPWVQFRDMVPLFPGARIERMDDSTQTIKNIFLTMLSMATAIYDRPTDAERRSWGMLNHYNCLVYQVCKNLAREKEPFEHVFETLDMVYDTSKALACAIVEGIAMLVVNLTYCYISVQVDDEVHPFVQVIENARPTPDLTRSPIPAVRYAGLDDMDLQDVQVAAKERGLRDSTMKEWLIGFILRNERQDRVAVLDGGQKHGVDGETERRLDKEKGLAGIGTHRDQDGEVKRPPTDGMNNYSNGQMIGSPLKREWSD